MTAKKVLNQALAEAVRIAGGQSALAVRIGKRQGDVWSWLYRTGVVPSPYLDKIEVAVGHRVTIRDLATGYFSGRSENETRADIDHAA